jgi:hypothetical protein
LFASLLFHGAGAGPDDTGPTVIEEGVHVRVRSASVARQPFFYSSFLQPVFARNGTGLTHVTAGQVPPGACSFDPHDGVRGACRAVISRGSWLSFEKGRGRWPTAPTRLAGVQGASVHRGAPRARRAVGHTPVPTRPGSLATVARQVSDRDQVLIILG